jgi:hypothetical protein
VLANGRGAHVGMIGGFALLGFEDDESPVLFIEHMAGAVHIEDERGLREARLMFDHLTSQALSPEEAITLVGRVLAE